jgi:hypothetical protein
MDFSPPTLIGYFEFSSQGGYVVKVELRRDGVWWSSDPRVRDYLEAVYDPHRTSSPARGQYGRMVLELAARSFGAVPHPPEGGWQESDPALIY